jgi:hypothetical protein
MHQDHLNSTGELWLLERIAQIHRNSSGWADEYRALDRELSQVDQDILNYRGQDAEGLAYLKKYAETLGSTKDSLVALVRGGNYPRFRG